MKDFLKKYGTNIIFICVVAALFLVPDAKAFLLQGFMKVGLFQPSLEQIEKEEGNLRGIVFEDAQGRLVDLGDLKGKVLFINFWATWCPPCRAEMPSINTLYARYKQDPNVVFMFIDVDGDFERAQKFLKNKNYPFPVYKIASNIPASLYQGALPTTLVFDKKARLSFKHEGVADYSNKKFVEFIDQLKALKH